MIRLDNLSGEMDDQGNLEQRVELLRGILKEMGRVVVAMSGGVDSMTLAVMANQVLGGAALAVTADSASLPRRELASAIDLAEQFGVQLRVIQTEEVQDARYAANTPQRCYFCKSIMFERLEQVRREFEAQWICSGENLDDIGDYRPGGRAGAEFGVRAPLKEAGMGKAEIRVLARQLGLPIWEKPASACLSSRIPYGMMVTPEKLRQVEAAEEVLLKLGFRQQRVRHHGDVARIEVAVDEMMALVERADEVVDRLKEIGFMYVALDLQGYRRGSLNEAIARKR